jgi:riboflavin biosynthesis pyrimidine reductase
MTRTERRVTANMVAGLDGAAAVGGRVAGLSNAADRALFQQLRAEADVVLVGAGTVRAERYGPVELTDGQVATRVAAARAPRPPIAVVTRSLLLDWTAPLFSSDGSVRPLVLTCTAAGTDAIDAASAHAEVILAGDDTVDLRAALDLLEQRGLACVLTEGGPALLGELIALDLLDELRLTLAPLVGGDPLPIASGLVDPGGARPLTPFTLADVRRDGDHLFLRYLTRRADRA